MHPYHHALSSQREHGGEVIDYLALHNWFDASKSALAHFTHRALHHHREGVAEAVRLFGTTICNAHNAAISVEALGLQHLAEDMSIIPRAADWLQHLEPLAAGAAFALPQSLPSAEQLAAAGARHFNASPDLLLPLHSWFLETATWFDDPRHCAMRHHSFGIFEAEQRFGIVLYHYHRSIPTRIVAEWHVRAVLGRIPAAADFLRRIKGQPWMAAAHNARRRGLCGGRLDDCPAPEQNPARQANRGERHGQS
jgi:hypothetical protein